jgi:hypothetical protein
MGISFSSFFPFFLSLEFSYTEVAPITIHYRRPLHYSKLTTIHAKQGQQGQQGQCNAIYGFFRVRVSYSSVLALPSLGCQLCRAQSLATLCYSSELPRGSSPDQYATPIRHSLYLTIPLCDEVGASVSSATCHSYSHPNPGRDPALTTVSPC